jgi:hypothetical protein
MSDTGFTVPGMTEPPRRYDVTTTVDQDGGLLPNPAEFAAAPGQAASAIAASIVSTHTAGQAISVVTVQVHRSARGRRRRSSRAIRGAQLPVTSSA